MYLFIFVYVWMDGWMGASLELEQLLDFFLFGFEEFIHVRLIPEKYEYSSPKIGSWFVSGPSLGLS
jgi:hypothetical protein